jgi:hypothetical protein
MLPVTMTQDFFAAIGADISTLNWGTLKQRDPARIWDYFLHLPTDLRHKADGILRGVFKLACTDGMTAINDAIEILHHEPLVLGKMRHVNDYARAMMTWKADVKVFHQALTLLQLKQLTWWRKRRHLPRKTPIFTDSIKQKFEQELESLFTNRQSRGYICTIEMLEMGNGMFYFFAHPDDHPTAILQHDESRELTPQVLLKTFEVIFAYDSHRGTLEVCGRVSAQIKKQLEDIFITSVLDSETDELEERVYDLSVLKNIHFEPYTDRMDQVYAEIQAIRFHNEDGFEYYFNAGQSNHLYEKIRGDLSMQRLLAEADVVDEAKIRFLFHAKGCRPYTSVTFEIGAPSKNTIRHLPQELIEIINKHLEQWGIEHHAKVN